MTTMNIISSMRVLSPKSITPENVEVQIQRLIYLLPQLSCKNRRDWDALLPEEKYVSLYNKYVSNQRKEKDMEHKNMKMTKLSIVDYIINKGIDVSGFTSLDDTDLFRMKIQEIMNSLVEKEITILQDQIATLHDSLKQKSREICAMSERMYDLVDKGIVTRDKQVRIDIRNEYRDLKSKKKELREERAVILDAISEITAQIKAKEATLQYIDCENSPLQ